MFKFFLLTQTILLCTTQKPNSSGAIFRDSSPFLILEIILDLSKSVRSFFITPASFHCLRQTIKIPNQVWTINRYCQEMDLVSCKM